MTAAQLIERLQTLPPDTRVVMTESTVDFVVPCGDFCTGNFNRDKLEFEPADTEQQEFNAVCLFPAEEA